MVPAREKARNPRLRIFHLDPGLPDMALAVLHFEYTVVRAMIPHAGCEGRQDPQQAVAGLAALCSLPLASRGVPGYADELPGEPRHEYGALAWADVTARDV